MPLPFSPPKELEHVTATFDKFCQNNKLEVLATAVDRHEAWEWSAAQKDEMDRFLTLLLTPVKHRSYSGQISAEAECEGRFARSVKYFRIEAAEFSSSKVVERLTWYLDWGWKKAKAFKEKQLHKPPYLPLPKSRPISQ